MFVGVIRDDIELISLELKNNDILDFSKMEAGKLKIDNIGFNIKEIVEEIIKIHIPYANKKGLELNYIYSFNISQLLIGDPNRLKQTRNNLISNAINFTERGYVTLSVEKAAVTDHYIELKFAVSDTGIGIPKEGFSRYSSR